MDNKFEVVQSESKYDTGNHSCRTMFAEKSWGILNIDNCKKKNGI